MDLIQTKLTNLSIMIDSNINTCLVNEDLLNNNDKIKKIFNLEKLKNVKTYYSDLAKKLNYNIDNYIKFAIIHSAQQFNFFYGYYKPTDSGIISEKILNIIMDDNSDENITNFINFLLCSSLPNIPKRIVYLEETLSCLHNAPKNFNEFFTTLLHMVSFNDDPFFKKGLLAIIELYRLISNSSSFHEEDDKWFSFKVEIEKIIDTLPIPADYRIPQWLAQNNIFYAHKILDKNLFEHQNEEIEIRATTIWIMRKIAYILEIKPYQLDGLIFTTKSNINNYHKCITTAY